MSVLPNKVPTAKHLRWVGLMKLSMNCKCDGQKMALTLSLK